MKAYSTGRKGTSFKRANLDANRIFAANQTRIANPLRVHGASLLSALEVLPSHILNQAFNLFS